MSSPNAVISGVRRAEQVFHEQVGQKQTLEYGIAFFDVEYPQSQQDNAFREVLIENPQVVPQAWAEAQAFYGQRKLQCHRWVPSLAQSLGVIEPFLTSQGMLRRSFAALAISSWPQIKSDRNVRVLPARAMRQAFRKLHADALTAQIEERRLDYAQFDVCVAIVDGQPAGRCGLLQAGEIAQVRDLHVAEPFRGRRVGATLLSHMLDVARRLMMKVVCTKTEADNAAGLDFLRACGFEQQGDMIEFHRR